MSVVAKDSLSFDRDDYTASCRRGHDRLRERWEPHPRLLIDGVDDFKLSVSANGDTDEGTAELEPGDYRIYCDVPGHESMEATLTVE